MIELCDDCDYTIMVADLIATLMTYDKHDIDFTLNIWCNGRDLPFPFSSDYHFEFLQEGIRVDTGNKLHYIWYDIIEYIRVDKDDKIK